MGTTAMQRESMTNVPVDVLAHSETVLGESWARGWLEARQRLVFEAGKQKCLIPTDSGSGDILREPADSRDMSRAFY